MVDSGFKIKLMSVCRDVLFDEEMKRHSSIQIGGVVFALCLPSSVDEIKKIISICNAYNFPCKVVGNSTNILYDDEYMDMCLISTKKLKGMNINKQKNCIDVMAGELLFSCYKESLENGLSGFEKLAGIPGTVGAGVINNTGAFGVSIGDLVYDVQVIDRHGKVFRIKKEDLCFSYRSSNLKKKEYVVLSVKFKLERKSQDEILACFKECKLKRLSSQPQLPSLGSVFKKASENISAGELIDKAGLKNLKCGGLQISSKHANFIVNVGNGKARDFKTLSSIMQREVQNKFNITLEREVEYIK